MIRIEILLEEPSAEQFLRQIAEAIVPDCPVETRVFQGKPDLLNRLPDRLRAYRAMRESGQEVRVLVLIDADQEDCGDLKRRLEESAKVANLWTKTRPDRDGCFAVVNRIAIEELEAWILGDVEALRSVYPRIPASLASKERFRDPDAISGGTAESLERLLRNHGYHKAGLPKIRVAAEVARYVDPARNRSRSFQCFREGLVALAQSQPAP